jgi:phage terminase Nu1 subunit (DNA packaging protein)
MQIIGKNKLAQAFKVSRTTIENWCRAGCPSKFNGKEHEFTLSEVIKWHEQRFLKNSDASDYEKSRATREHFKALLSELEYKERSGELISAKDVREAAFEKARTVRDSLLNIPARVSPILAAEHDAKKVNEMLDKEIRQCLETLSGDLENDSGAN